MSIYQWAKGAQLALSQFTPTESFVLKQSYPNIYLSAPDQKALDQESFIIVRWLGPRKIEILEDFSTVADIALPLLPCGTAQIQFPTQPTHELSIKPLRLINVDKWFVYNSNPYLWEIISTFTARDYTLYKGIGDRKVEIGRFKQWGNRINGTVSLDTREIDKIVGLSTFVVILRGK
jgi:hypothetical protein